MRVMHVITGLDTGGAEMMLSKLLAATDRSKFSHHIVSLADMGTFGEEIVSRGYEVTTLNIRSMRDLPGAAYKLLRAARAYKPDLIQGWMTHGNVAALLAQAALWGRPRLLWNVRQSVYDLRFEKPGTQLVMRVAAWLAKRPRHIIYNSTLARTTHEMLGYPSSSGKMIPNGFELERFKLDEATRQRIRGSLSISPSAPVIGLFARFHPTKDHKAFLQAAVEVRDQIPNVCFILAGTGVAQDNPLFAEIIPKGLEGSLRLLGDRRDVEALMSACDVFCSSSIHTESFSNSIGEAMATGLPCVVTDVGDAAAIVGNAGVVVPPGASDDLAEAMVGLLRDPISSRAMGLRARRRVEESFSIEAIVGMYENFYASVVDAEA